MGDRKLDRLYRRFQRDGDVSALGTVFDLAAPELLKVARHLCGDEAEAEDALQETFLTAIQDRERYDPARRFMPWMLGILTNRAREARRRSERVADPSRLAPVEAGDPADSAVERELRRAIDEGVAGLPQTYRAAVRAYLADGEKPAEIARALGISDNAANVRIHRGLRLLRKSLPAVGAVSALFGPAPRGLAAVRHRVLAEALEHGGTLAATTTSLAVPGLTGGILMSKSALAVAAVGLAILAAWIAWPLRVAGDPFVSPRVAGSTPSLLAPDSQAGESRAPVATRGADAAAPGLPPGSLRVHVQYTDGAPASNLEAWVASTFGESSGRDRRRAVTDGSGTAVFTDVPEGRVRAFSPLSRTPLQTPDGEREVRMVAGETTDAVLVVPDGCDVRAIVEDPTGRRVAGAEVYLGPRNRLEPSHLVGRTGIEGDLDLKAVGPDLSIFACRDGLGLSPLVDVADSFAGEPEARERSATVVLRLDGAAGGLEGRVLRGDGEPATDACVRVSRVPRGPDLVAHTDPGGRFRVAGLDGLVRLLVLDPDHAPQFESLRVGYEERAEVVIQLGPGVTIRGQVRDGTGTPVAGASIRQRVPDVASEPFQTYLNLETETSLDGTYVLERAAIGRYDLDVYAEGRGGGLDSRARTTIEAGHGDVVEWSPTLGGGGTIAGQVVDARGQPLIGWTVRAWTGGREPNPSEDKTDGAGRFELTGCADVAHTVRVWSPLSGTSVLTRPWVRPDGDPLLLVVEDPGTAAIGGTVISYRGEPVGGASVRWSSESSNASGAQTDAEGRFQIEALDPGSGRLVVSQENHGAKAFGPFDLLDGEDFDAGTLELAEPGTVRVTLVPPVGVEMDAAIREASVFLHGRPWGDVARRNVDGGFDSNPLAPGAYVVAARGQTLAAPTRSVTVLPGEELDVEIPVKPGVFQRIWLATEPEAGNPGPTRLRVRDEAGDLVVDLELDFDGVHQREDGSYRVLFAAGLVPGPHAYEVTTASGLAASGTFEVTTGEDTPVVVLGVEATSD